MRSPFFNLSFNWINPCKQLPALYPHAMLREVFEVDTDVGLIAGQLPHVLPQSMRAV